MEEGYKSSSGTEKDLKKRVGEIYGGNVSLINFMVESHGGVKMGSYEEVYGKSWKNTFRKLRNILTFSTINPSKNSSYNIGF